MGLFQVLDHFNVQSQVSHAWGGRFCFVTRRRSVEHHIWKITKLLPCWDGSGSTNDPREQSSWHWSIQQLRHQPINTATIQSQLLIFTLLKNPSSKSTEMWTHWMAGETFPDRRWKTTSLVSSPAHPSAVTPNGPCQRLNDVSEVSFGGLFAAIPPVPEQPNSCRSPGLSPGSCRLTEGTQPLLLPSVRRDQTSSSYPSLLPIPRLPYVVTSAYVWNDDDL